MSTKVRYTVLASECVHFVGATFVFVFFRAFFAVVPLLLASTVVVVVDDSHIRRIVLATEELR